MMFAMVDDAEIPQGEGGTATAEVTAPQTSADHPGKNPLVTDLLSARSSAHAAGERLTIRRALAHSRKLDQRSSATIIEDVTSRHLWRLLWS
jgi:hypothetical protein